MCQELMCDEKRSFIDNFPDITSTLDIKECNQPEWEARRIIGANNVT